MMMRCVNGRWSSLFACALFALGLAGSGPAKAASLASSFGRELPQAEPQGGYVGRLDVTPAHGPAGTPLTVTAQGLPADQEFQLVWRTVIG
ncbi:MAG: hypothetical protein ACREDY_11765, partial [Bradyrhizobium sp.]